MKPPKFGRPVADIGPRRQHPQTAFWMTVVAHAKKNPGVWIPLIDPPNSKRSLQNIASSMRLRRNSDQVPIPMQEWGMKGQVVEGVFYFRYDELPKVHVLKSAGEPWGNQYNPARESG